MPHTSQNVESEGIIIESDDEEEVDMNDDDDIEDVIMGNENDDDDDDEEEYDEEDEGIEGVIVYDDYEDDEEIDDDDDDEDNEGDETEESSGFDEFENITIRKRLTEPHVYVRGKGRGKFECPKCGWRARKLCVLKRHIMVSHAHFKPFLCTYCKCAFKTKGNLVRHTKTKAHLRACSKLGMSPTDEEVTRITSKNIDNSQLSKQLEIDKKIKVS